MCVSLNDRLKKQQWSAGEGFYSKKKKRRFVFQLTGIVAVTGVNDAKDVVSGRLLFTVPVLVDKSSSAAPLPQLWKHLPLRNTHVAVHHHPHLHVK